MKYENYLLDELNKVRADLKLNEVTIKVIPERSFKLPKEQNVLLFVVKKLTGAFVLNVKTTPVQVICYSELNTFSIAQQICEYFVKLHHQESFHDTIENEKGEEVEALIKQDYDTPVMLRAILPTDIGFKASMYFFGSYTICEGIADIKNIYMAYRSGVQTRWEEVKYIDTSITYAAVVNTNKVRGQELSTSLKQEAGLTLNMTIMNNDSRFCQRVNSIMLGESSGNSKFRLRFELNGTTYTKDFTLDNASLSVDRVSAPGLAVTLRL